MCQPGIIAALHRFHYLYADAATLRIVTLLRWQQRRDDIVDFAAPDQQQTSAPKHRVLFQTKSGSENGDRRKRRCCRNSKSVHRFVTDF
jgi:hypothetical protein